jgi:hypothetical protein
MAALARIGAADSTDGVRLSWPVTAAPLAERPSVGTTRLGPRESGCPPRHDAPP